jgi:hypothetical protein
MLHYGSANTVNTLKESVTVALEKEDLSSSEIAE